MTKFNELDPASVRASLANEDRSALKPSITTDRYAGGVPAAAEDLKPSIVDYATGDLKPSFAHEIMVGLRHAVGLADPGCGTMIVTPNPPEPITWGQNTSGPAGIPVPVVLTAATCSAIAVYYPDGSPTLYPDGWWVEYPGDDGSCGTADEFRISVPDGTPAGIVFTDGVNTYATVGGNDQHFDALDWRIGDLTVLVPVGTTLPSDELVVTGEMITSNPAGQGSHSSTITILAPPGLQAKITNFAGTEYIGWQDVYDNFELSSRGSSVPVGESITNVQWRIYQGTDNTGTLLKSIGGNPATTTPTWFAHSGTNDQFDLRLDQVVGTDIWGDVYIELQITDSTNAMDTTGVHIPRLGMNEGPVEMVVASDTTFDPRVFVAGITNDVYEWDFGDGNSSIGQFATHTYTSASGPYTVTLDGFPRIAPTWLDLPNEDMLDIGDWSQFRRLGTITLSNSTGYADLFDLTDLEALVNCSVINCGLTSLPSLAGLANLKIFNVSTNQIAGGLQLGGNDALETLTITANQFTGNLDITESPNLKELLAADSGFAGGSLVLTQSQDTPLEELYIQGSELGGTFPSLLRQTSLKVLNCKNCFFSGAFPSVANNTAMTDLLVGNQNGQGNGNDWSSFPADLTHLANLENLDLQRLPNLTSNAPDVTALTNLVVYDISNSPNIGGPLSDFATCTAMQVLLLGGTSVSGSLSLPASIAQVAASGVNLSGAMPTPGTAMSVYDLSNCGFTDWAGGTAWDVSFRIRIDANDLTADAIDRFLIDMDASGTTPTQLYYSNQSTGGHLDANRSAAAATAIANIQARGVNRVGNY